MIASGTVVISPPIAGNSIEARANHHDAAEEMTPDRAVLSSVLGGAPCRRVHPSDRNAPLAACTLVWAAFRQSTDNRPVSTARIVQRRAAIQNACRCPVEQNR